MKFLIILLTAVLILPSILSFRFVVDKRYNVLKVGLKELVSVLTAKTERMHQILEDVQTMIDSPVDDENTAEKRQEKEQLRRKLFLRNHYSPKVTIGGETLAQHIMVVRERPILLPAPGNNSTVDKVNGRI